jgi:cytidylate kinase
MSTPLDARPRVICISRSLGAGGEVVGRLVSSELSFDYVDEEIVEKAAEKVQVPADLVADAEERKPLLNRLLGQVVDDLAGASMFTGVAPPSELFSASDDYRDLIEQAILETASRGEVVIVAHAASIALASQPDVLRALITASPEIRAGRLKEELGLSDTEATELVRKGDRARADYFKRFYGLKQELPTHYDLVLNTDLLAPELAARLVLAACDRSEAQDRSGRASD